jgi:WD40 repeat protein
MKVTPRRWAPLAPVVVLCLCAAGRADPPTPAPSGPLGDRYGDPLPPNAVGRLGTIRLRHSGEVNSLALSPDNKLIATAAGSVWDAETGREVDRFHGKLHAEVVAFSPDGKTLLAGSREGWVQHWDVATGKLLREAGARGDGEHFNGVVAVFSPDRKFFALTDHYGTARLLDTQTGKKLLEFKRDQTLQSIAVSHDGKTLATGGQDKLIHLWDAATGTERRRLEGRDSWTYALRFSPDDKLLASLAKYNLRLWDVETGKVVWEREGGMGPMAFSADGKTIATGYRDTIRLLDATTGKDLRVLTGHSSSSIPALAFSADGKWLVSGGRDHTVVMWDLATGKPRHQFDGHRAGVYCMAFSPDAKLLATGGDEDHALIIWDVKARSPRHILTDHYYWVLCTAFSPDGKTVATGDGINGIDDREAQIRLWDAETGKLRRRFFGHLNAVQSLAYSPDGKLLASAGWDARVRIWDPSTGERLQQLRLTDSQKTLEFSTDGKTLQIHGGWDGFSGKWSVVSEGDGPPLRSVEPPKINPPSPRARRGSDQPLTRSRDGKLMASVPDDYLQRVAIELRDVESGALLAMLRGHQGAVRSLAFSPDGKTLASGSWDTTVLLWDVWQAQLPGLWAALGRGGDAAVNAERALAANPDGAVPYLRERLRSAAAQAAPYLRAIGALDSERFAEREKAARELEAAGPAAEFALRLALAGGLPAEAERRAGELLERLTSRATEEIERLMSQLEGRRPSADVARDLEALGPSAVPALRRMLENRSPRSRLSFWQRSPLEQALNHLDTAGAVNPSSALGALSVLAQINTAEGRAVLRELAGGPAQSHLTRQAQAALDKLGKPGEKP